jgi:hypothetical protein
VFIHPPLKEKESKVTRKLEVEFCAKERERELSEALLIILDWIRLERENY